MLASLLHLYPIRRWNQLLPLQKYSWRGSKLGNTLIGQKPSKRGLLSTAGIHFHLPFRKCALPGLHMNALRQMPKNRSKRFLPAGQHLPTGHLLRSSTQAPLHLHPRLLPARPRRAGTEMWLVPANSPCPHLSSGWASKALKGWLRLQACRGKNTRTKRQGTFQQERMGKHGKRYPLLASASGKLGFSHLPYLKTDTIYWAQALCQPHCMLF